MPKVVKEAKRVVLADGQITLICADCLDVLQTFEANAVVTDPPYGVELTERVTKFSNRSASKLYADDDESWTSILERVKAVIGLKLPTAITPGNRRLLAYPPAADIGCVYFPNGAGHGPWGFTMFNPVLYYGDNPKGFNVPSSVSKTHWFSEDVDHPCPKPVQWMEWMIDKVSFPLQTVLDPFMGSGTTGVACLRTSRRFIGIEIEPHYFNIAVGRIKAELWRASKMTVDPKSNGKHQPTIGEEM